MRSSETTASAKKDKVDWLINSILTYVVDHQLAIGSKLPSEEEFTHLFGVSRVCVREALRGLKFLGVVETGTRRGTTIKEVDFTLLSRALSFQIAVSDVSYLELLNARIAIELGAINLVIERVSAQELDEWEKLADCTSEDNDMRVMQVKDYEFHKKLISLAGNQILLSFSHMLELFFSRPIARGKTNTQLRVNEEHLLLVRAIREKNKDLAKGLLYSHLVKYIQSSKVPQPPKRKESV